MKKLFTTLLAQLPRAEMHGLGTTLLAVALVLLGYYEYVGDRENAKTVLIALLPLMLPAPLRSRNATADAPDAAEPDA